MLKKQYRNNRRICAVTFTLPEGIQAKTACVVGDFNAWNPTSHVFRRIKGAHQVTIDLETGKQYEFRYLVDTGDCFNDDRADRYVPNPFGTDNSVVEA